MGVIGWRDLVTAKVPNTLSNWLIVTSGGPDWVVAVKQQFNSMNGEKGEALPVRNGVRVLSLYSCFRCLKERCYSSEAPSG